MNNIQHENYVYNIGYDNGIQEGITRCRENTKELTDQVKELKKQNEDLKMVIEFNNKLVVELIDSAMLQILKSEGYKGI